MSGSHPKENPISMNRSEDRGFAATLTPWAAIMIASFCAAGCTYAATENMLNSAGPAAARIERLWWQMFAVYGIVYLITLVLLFVALSARRRERTPIGNRFVFFSGIAIPLVILIIMLAITIHDTVELGRGEDDFQVRVKSHHWWFEVHYPDYGISDANEIHIPVGARVNFELQSHGVVHSFWVPRLGGKRDMLPDHPTYLTLTADQAGEFAGRVPNTAPDPMR
jgi:cytochrome c oxidase subunit II